MTQLPHERAPWTPEERELLKKAYTKGGYKAAVKALPYRSVASVYRRARVEGVYRRRPWCEEDDAKLRVQWSEGRPLPSIARALGRTQATAYVRAQKIGLSLGVPPDFENLTAAAKRTGYPIESLRKILEWAGVPVKEGLSRPRKRVSSRRCRIVETMLVDEAVSAWLAAEPVECVARRLGTSGAWLRELARRAGHTTPGRKYRLRLTDEQARALLADRSLRKPRGGYQGGRRRA